MAQNVSSAEREGRAVGWGAVGGNGAFPYLLHSGNCRGASHPAQGSPWPPATDRNSGGRGPNSAPMEGPTEDRAQGPRGLRQALDPPPALLHPCSLRSGGADRVAVGLSYVTVLPVRGDVGPSRDIQTWALPGGPAACASATPAPVTSNVRGGLDAQLQLHSQVSKVACAIFL